MEDNILILEDEQGNPAEFEVYDVYELNGKTYFALIEVIEGSTEENDEVVIMRVEGEGEGFRHHPGKGADHHRHRRDSGGSVLPHQARDLFEQVLDEGEFVHFSKSSAAVAPSAVPAGADRR